MAKNEITKENVYYIPHYRYILNLLIEFQDKKGLNFEHLKRILVKKFNINTLDGDIYKRARKFAVYGIIKPNDISSESNLNRILRRLLPKKLPNSLGIIKKSKDNKPKYSIKKRYIKELIGLSVKFENKRIIDEYNLNYISSFPAITKDLPHDEKQYAELLSIVVYGISDKLYNSLTDSEKNKITDYINEIEKLLEKIERIRARKIINGYDSIIEKTCNEFNNKNQKLKEFVQKNLVYFIELSKLIYKEKKFALEQLEHKEIQHMFFNFFDDKTLGISREDKIDFLYNLSLNLNAEKSYDELYYDFVPYGITFSRYIRLSKNEIIDSLQRMASIYKNS